MVVTWIAVVAGLAVWSVPHDPATVPDQRDIGQAVPDLQRATGAVVAAAAGPGRALVLGALVYAEPCRVTLVRSGLLATRDVTVYVRDGGARAALEAIAAALPVRYGAGVGVGSGGTRLALHADAGDFIGIDASSDAEASSVTLRVSTGCRPPGHGRPDGTAPAAGPVPAVLHTVLAALGAPAADGPTDIQAVACPDGGVVGTYTVDRVPAPADLPDRLAAWAGGASVVRGDGALRAYRVGDDSVVVAADGPRLRASVTSSC